MGLDEHDWGRPLVGIATTWTGTMPCNLCQRALAAHVAAGVEAVGAQEGGRISDAELDELERNAGPGFGACTGHFTANTMAVAFDFLGLGPVGLGSITATDPAKAAAGVAAGRLVLDVIERGLR